MAATIPPTDPEQLERWRHDPDAYAAIERLHIAYEQLTAALDEQVNATGIQFSMMYEPHRAYLLEKNPAIETENQGRLRLARRQIEMAQVDWVAAVSKADALLRELLRDRESGRKAESKRDNEKMREAHAAWAIPPARREGLLLQVLGDERLVIRELTDRLNAELRFPSSENRWYAVYQSHVRSLLMRMVREGQLERTPEMFKNKVRYRYSRKLPLEGPIVGLERTYQDDQDDQEGGE